MEGKRAHAKSGPFNDPHFLSAVDLPCVTSFPSSWFVLGPQNNTPYAEGRYRSTRFKTSSDLMSQQSALCEEKPHSSYTIELALSPYEQGMRAT